jgi:phosphatidylglycerophosphate synthase
VRDGSTAVVAAVLLCGALVVGVGLSRAALVGAVAGVGIVVAAAGSVVARAGRWSGPADRVTLGRVVLIAGCTTVAVPMFAGTLAPRGWLLMALLVPALLLDAVDGKVARRTGTASAAGGRLDGEMDAALLMVASLAAVPALGWWVPAIGLMRYVFWAAGYVRPHLLGPLAFSQFRRVVAGVQGVMLAVGLAPVVPVPVGQVAVAVALFLLCLSFGRDVIDLESRRM